MSLFELHEVGVDIPLARGITAALGGHEPRVLNILDGITLDLHAGETLGLVGESGSGKTTLARAMLGLRAARGQMRFQGQPLVRAVLRRATAMMFQDPVASLSPRMRVGDAVCEPYVIQRIPRSRRRSAADLLDSVGLPPSLAALYPHELSGGQARRVCAARALALNPALVIADEPTAGLDVSIQGDILNLMADLKRERGIGLMIITHNLPVIRHSAERIAVLYLGRLVETGPTPEVFARPAHPYTASLIASQPNPDPRKRRADLAIRGEVPSLLRRPPGCPFHTRCPVARDICARVPPPEIHVSATRRVRCHFPLIQPDRNGPQGGQ
ncbi:MAG: ABC transporter ATP-binding protein [Rubellimicrobium sp.]|nr:ABC transporter ATP-binding protein [Rubellimicrobium sp.]